MPILGWSWGLSLLRSDLGFKKLKIFTWYPHSIPNWEPCKLIKFAFSKWISCHTLQVLSALNLYRFVLIRESTGKCSLTMTKSLLDYVWVNVFCGCFYVRFGSKFSFWFLIRIILSWFQWHSSPICGFSMMFDAILVKIPYPSNVLIFDGIRNLKC